MIRTALLVMGMVCLSLAQTGMSEDVWEPFRFFEGEWIGEETGNAGVGKGERTIEFIMEEK